MRPFIHVLGNVTLLVLMAGCPAQAAWEEALQITVTWDSETESMGESSSSTGATETGSTTGGPTTGLSGTMSDSATGTTIDPTTATNSTTAANTTEPAVCGDGEVQTGEDCDDGNDENNDACTNECESAECGDGYLGPAEECDDGNQNDDDGCNTACARDRVVFVTLEGFTGHLSGIVGATSVCRAAALNAELDNHETYLPWLSDSETSPSQSFFRSKGRYVLPDMVTVVADNWNDLVDASLHNPIDMTEYGEWLDGSGVWTSTTPSGTLDPEMLHCNNWSQTDAEGFRGVSEFTDSGWTRFGIKATCGNYARLYCFEQ